MEELSNNENSNRKSVSLLQNLANRSERWIDNTYHSLTTSTRASGIILIFATILAMLLCNMDFSKDWYQNLWSILFQIKIGNDVYLDFTFIELVNDGLMSVFFFAIGLEIKEEFKYGHLSTWRQAALPVVAAAGGMCIPALIYSLCNIGSPDIVRHGWGVPMATDIAFSLGILSMFSKKVPFSLRVFLATLAVADDLGAIIVIALVYSNSVNLILIAVALLFAIFMFFLNYLNILQLKYYILPSLAIWVLFALSGVHVTIAGVLIAFAMPVGARMDPKAFVEQSYKQFRFDHNGKVQTEDDEGDFIDKLKYIRKNVVKSISPLVRLEDSIKEIVNFIIMPLFAFANAGVVISSDMMSGLFSGESLGIIFGLVIGKPLGICLVSYLFMKYFHSGRFDGAVKKAYIGVGCLGGIGFTMSIFIDTLAFYRHPELIATGKMAIMLGSLISALIGTVILMSLRDVDKKYQW